MGTVKHSILKDRYRWGTKTNGSEVMLRWSVFFHPHRDKVLHEWMAAKGTSVEVEGISAIGYIMPQGLQGHLFI